jgi:hypothetical protein
MYSVATFRLSKAADFSPMLSFSRVMVWVALIAWLITMAGLVRSMARNSRSGPPELSATPRTPSVV